MENASREKYGVSVTLRSLQEGRRSVLKAKGEAIAKGSDLYIRYEEPGEDPQGNEAPALRTMLKIAGDGLTIIRHGSVESEQAFTEGKRLPGYYRSPYTRFNLSTETRNLNIRREGRAVAIDVAYVLYVYEELSGQFELSFNVQEEMKS